MKASASDNLLTTSMPISSASSLAPMMAASATSSKPSTPMLNAQLGSDEWPQALSQQIVIFGRNDQQNAELRLHPEDLGAIQISLKPDNDQAQINLVSSHSHVRSGSGSRNCAVRWQRAESTWVRVRSAVTVPRKARASSNSRRRATMDSMATSLSLSGQLYRHHANYRSRRPSPSGARKR